MQQLFYVELETKTSLHLYGVSALDALTTQEYENTISEVVFECIKFEHIVYPPVMQELRKYKQLQSIVLIRNGLASFVMLSKLEALEGIKKLSIYLNPVCNLTTLSAFIAYRFQHVNEINGRSITVEDRKIAKQEFEKFDRSLASATLANKKHISYKKLGCNKTMIKSIAKENDLASMRCSNKVTGEIETIQDQRKTSENSVEDYAVSFVYSYVAGIEDGSAYLEEHC